MIRVVTLNCWKNEGDLRARLPLMCYGLRALAPDIACLQEVYADPNVSVAQELADSLELELVAHPARRKLRGEVISTSGLAILTRWPVLRFRAIDLPTLDADGQRLAQLVTIRSPRGDVRALNLHLTHLRGGAGAALRTAELKSALAWATSDGREPLIVAGDLNAAADSAELAATFAAYKADFGPHPIAHFPPTHISAQARAIDHVALIDPSGAWRIANRKLELKEPFSPSGLRASDHAAVVVTMVRDAADKP